MAKASIIIVEDERIIALDLKNSLKNLGYAVEAIVSSGEKAIEKVAEIHPDLVLMDIMLQGKMDGVEAAEVIRTLYQVPVVFLTSHTDEATLEKAKKTKPFGYIVKPFEERDLHTTLEIALARAKAEAEVRKALEKEKELNELKSRFVSMVSHEFRTPMSTILFSATLLENYGDRWTEEKKVTHLHRIQTAIKQMTEMLDYILVIGQTDAGKLEFNPTGVELKKFCGEIMEEMQLNTDYQHPIEWICLGDCTEAKMDEKLLRHILSNLLSNAIKYSPPKSSIKFELTCEQDQAVFRIEDKGIGITAEDQKRLFETFHRGTNVGTISGTGLGLAIVKRAVDLHGGQISCQSEVGAGTAFTVTLPMRNHV
ncbi:ATP-binding protein [Microcoleus sp. FACHB-672]|uniref:hybrid sensor histidine kinase/response regulator n=1 Tax=Microcoleus sp. FACHB-672 TaxID=2692825 RepID=UPI001684AAAF|nr:ATP-binding protein [Microcoleus sp. FACHB-672]MBD2043448.1 response regulator [Microcoleus sp. FACHB-672]